MKAGSKIVALSVSLCLMLASPVPVWAGATRPENQTENKNEMPAIEFQNPSILPATTDEIPVPNPNETPSALSEPDEEEVSDPDETNFSIHSIPSIDAETPFVAAISLITGSEGKPSNLDGEGWFTIDPATGIISVVRPEGRRKIYMDLRFEITLSDGSVVEHTYFVRNKGRRLIEIGKQLPGDWSSISLTALEPFYAGRKRRHHPARETHFEFPSLPPGAPPGTLGFFFNDRKYNGVNLTGKASIGINFTFNHLPTTEDAEVEVTEDTPQTFQLPATDLNGNPLTYEIVTDPLLGTLTPLNDTGLYQYTPNLNINGEDVFTFRANDGQGWSNISTITLNIAAVDDPPTGDEQSVDVDDNTPIVVTLTGSDVDNSPIEFEIVDGPEHGEITDFDEDTGTLNYQSDVNFNGSDTFTFRVKGGSQYSDPVTVTMNVTDRTVPTGTILINDGDAYTNNRNVTLTLTTDEEDAEISFSLNSLNNFGPPMDFPESGTLSYTISGFNGPNFVNWKICDPLDNCLVGGAGAESVLGVNYDSIIFDNGRPTGTLLLNNGDEFTNSRAAVLTLNLTDNISAVDNLQVSYAFNNGPFTAFEPVVVPEGGGDPTLNVTLPAPSGEHFIKVKVKDQAGNISVILFESIKLDKPPTAMTVTINAGETATNFSDVTVALTGIADDYTIPANMMVRYAINSTAEASFTAWMPFSASFDIIIPKFAGANFINFQLKDERDNVSPVYFDSIDYVPVFMTINDGVSPFSTSRTVTVKLNDILNRDDVANVRFSVNKPDGGASGDPETLTDERVFTFTTDGPKYINALLTFDSGETISVFALITIDTAHPQITASSVTDITSESANVNVSTNEWTRVRVEYGTDTNYGESAESGPELDTEHILALMGLGSSTLYHYRICVTDQVDFETCSDDSTFTTSS